MQSLFEPVRLLTRSTSTYSTRLARDASEVGAAQALRFAVFNLELNEGLVESPWRTQPLPAFDCPLNQLADEPAKIPKLLRAYLTIGAKICGPPAPDRQFKTIDFLTLLDLHAMPALVRARFLS